MHFCLFMQLSVISPSLYIYTDISDKTKRKGADIMQEVSNRQHKEMYKAGRYISNNLRLLRIIKGYSQQQVAERLHISRSCYCCIESGERTPDLLVLYDISQLFDIKLEYLVSFDITEQFFKFLSRDNNKLTAESFIKKYLRLSCESKKQMFEKVEFFTEKENDVNLFPWDYSTDMEI